MKCLFCSLQVATVLANMAAKDAYRESVSSGGSLMLLLGFLQLSPAAGHGAPQLSACERVQQKAAIALARLCTDAGTSNIVAKMQGRPNTRPITGSKLLKIWSRSQMMSLLEGKERGS